MTCVNKQAKTLYSTWHRNANEWRGTGGNQISTCATHFLVRDSSVGIANHYSLDGPGIETRWGRGFPNPSGPALGSNQSPIQWVPCLFPGGKAAGAWRWPPTPSSAEVAGRVELYIHSPSGTSWPVLGWTLPLPLPLPLHHTSELAGFNIDQEAGDIYWGFQSFFLDILGKRWEKRLH